MSDADRRKWDAKYRARDHIGEPSPSLLSLAHHLPTGGKALDVAGGAGRNALWLAERGLDVTLVDISPSALAMAQQQAAHHNLPLTTLALDLDSAPLPPGPWDLIINCYFLSRPLFTQYPSLLAPNGRLVVIHPTRTNLTKHDKPPAEYLLADSELPELTAHLKAIHYTEAWTPQDRHEAQFVGMCVVQRLT